MVHLFASFDVACVLDCLCEGIDDDVSSNSTEEEEPNSTSKETKSSSKDESDFWKRVVFFTFFFGIMLYMVLSSFGDGNGGGGDGFLDQDNVQIPPFQAEPESDSSGLDSDSSSINSSNPDEDALRDAFDAMRDNEVSRQFFLSELELVVRSAVNEGVLTQDEAQTQRDIWERAFERAISHNDLNSMQYIRQSEAELLEAIQLRRGN
jgi:hypothetical protein